MNNFFNELNRGLWGIVIKAILAFIFCAIYAGIKIAIFGDSRESEATLIESAILLSGSILLSSFIVNKISKRHK